MRVGETQATGKKVPSWAWIRCNVSIVEVAKALDLDLVGRRIRCPRKSAHKHDDASPSMVIGTKTNKVYCMVCDRKPLSNIDLVALVLGLGPKHAAEWIIQRWRVPETVRQQVTKTKDGLWRFTKTGYYMAEVPEFAISYKAKPTKENVDQLTAYIFGGPDWRTVPASTIKVLLVLWQKARKQCPFDEPPFCISYSQRQLADMTGVERPTIRKALQWARSIGLVECDSGYRSVHEEARRSAYIRFTPYTHDFAQFCGSSRSQKATTRKRSLGMAVSNVAQVAA